MTVQEFASSVKTGRTPAVTPALQALWQDAAGDWNAAHRIAQEIDNRTGAWVHAYLHRKEGDVGNAAYWYARAGKPVYSGSLQEEWESVVSILLAEDK